MAKFELIWDAPEFEYHEKGVSWYWISIIVAACIVAFAVWFQNFLFGFFIVIAEILFIVWGNRAPQAIHFAMDENGIGIGDRKFHDFKEFESWSAETATGDLAEIFFYFRSRVRPALKVLMPQEKLDELRADLKTILKEVEHQPSLLDAIEKILRF
jgi:hypothetical protein